MTKVEEDGIILETGRGILQVGLGRQPWGDRGLRHISLGQLHGCRLSFRTTSMDRLDMSGREGDKDSVIVVGQSYPQGQVIIGLQEA